jgi:hypothetical protein
VGNPQKEIVMKMTLPQKLQLSQSLGSVVNFGTSQYQKGVATAPPATTGDANQDKLNADAAAGLAAAYENTGDEAMKLADQLSTAIVADQPGT